MLNDASQSRLRTLQLLAVLTSLALRLLWGVSVPIVPVSDSAAYEVFARNIALGNGFGWEPNQPTAYWPVGAPAIYGLLFWMFGQSYAAVMVLQVIVGVAVVALAIALARKWFGETVAVATGWILACWPLLIQYTTILASELFFLLFVLLAFWLASVPGRTWLARGLASGVALAVASYIRPTALVMAPLLFLEESTRRNDRARAMLGCIIAVLAMAVCILPWAVRNWFVFDKVVLVSTNGGTNLWMGNNPKAATGYMELPQLNIANEAEKDRFLGRQAKDYIVQDPVAFLVRMVRKVVDLHARETIGVAWNAKGLVQKAGERVLTPLKLVSSAYWLIILTAAIYGLYAYARSFGIRRLLACQPLAIWAYFTLVHAVTVAGDRYHVPSIPFVAMIAAYAISGFWTAGQIPKAA